MKKKSLPFTLPSARDWRTTDEDERNRRRARAMEEKFKIRNQNADRPVFSNFSVSSGSGMSYSVEIRDIAERDFSCTCADFRKNGLGTCKHTEAVLMYLEAARPRLYKEAIKQGSDLIEIALNQERAGLCVKRGLEELSGPISGLFDKNGLLNSLCSPEEAVVKLKSLDRNGLRVSQDIEPWLESRAIAAQRKELRRDYESKVQSGIYPQHETNVPLYPYQRQGMLHLAFTERALLADEMGLGKTIQAIAACALLRRLGTARRVLVVTPASLKSEWEEQIQKFTSLPLRVVYGMRRQRLIAYDNPAFFTIVNYEQVRSDSLDLNARLRPEIVILDEAQRIKNWSTGTAQAVKRLRSRYAFVLTGTPLENRIDELYSIVEFLDPTIFGPLFRFNREFYTFDERGRPAEYRNLEKMHEKIKTVMLRRRKADVETELPGRSDSNRFVPMTKVQWDMYADHKAKVARLLAVSKYRPLTKEEQEKLMRELAMMRMVCDSPYILDQSNEECPKIEELETIFEDALAEKEVKIVIFSEWVRMLELVKKLCERKDIGYAWHTGSVPQRRRRAEINLFKSDPTCRVFLSSESGGVGLNLQNASVVINCDLPWNPARLEQRIARVWRKHQKNTVSIFNLVAENTIEHGMLQTLAVKQGLADGVLDRIGDFASISLKGGAHTFFKRLEQVMSTQPQATEAAPPKQMPADRVAAFAQQVKQKLNGRIVSCEEHFPLEGAHSTLLVVVEHGATELREQVTTAHAEFFGPGKCDPLAPVNFDIIDRATFEALRRLEEQGLITRTVRASRNVPLDADARPPLSDEDRKKIESLRALAARKLTASRALLGAGLADEARPSTIEAALILGKMLSVKQGMQEPKNAEQTLLPPWNTLWNGGAARIRLLIEKQEEPCGDVVGYLNGLATEVVGG